LARKANVVGEETRAEILRTARACFAAYGYAATTTRMVAQQAGVTNAAVYHYFPKKRDMMVAVNQATQAVALEGMLAATAKATTFVGKVEALLDAAHDLLRQDPELAAFAWVARDEMRRHAELDAMRADHAITDLYRDLVAFGVAEGAVAPEDRQAALGAITALSQGLASMAIDVSVPAHATITDGCKQLLMGTLFADSAGVAAPKKKAAAR
jgi:AcrR family transcriptional regulator